MAEDVYVGIDVGGTKVLAGVVDNRGRILRTVHRATPGRRVDVSIVEDALTEALGELVGDGVVRGVGLAAAGFVDVTGERVMFAPHLPWVDSPVRARLEERWQVPVALENDATATAHAEATYGAASGVEDAVVVTLGTGIGGGIILGRQVHRGANGMAGEFGHIQVVPGGAACECGGHGCWEQYASGNALVRFAREGLGTRPSILEELCEGNPSALTGPMVTRAAEEGDLLAHEAFGQVGDWLGVGLANLVAALDPGILVVGGGVSAAGDRLLEPARTALLSSLVGAGHRTVPPLVVARFGAQAGLVGAADLARQRVARLALQPPRGGPG
ncbi:ROK family protein [Nocardioides sp. JQ2195]|uniref:ROK family protein n=1 Tax=Nocardioides sp. JQ2195 TaxID=2592334 RepID=UPI00143EC635|nr:ROK family protein [Nocardioides sp. JQ2195]QIX26317.1 ROK family protein [Nocardioides sp. JQ2195]